MSFRLIHEKNWVRIYQRFKNYSRNFMQRPKGRETVHAWKSIDRFRCTGIHLFPHSLQTISVARWNPLFISGLLPSICLLDLIWIYSSFFIRTDYVFLAIKCVRCRQNTFNFGSSPLETFLTKRIWSRLRRNDFDD